MKWIYLSPHLDDAALSCGGLIWQQTQAGQPLEVWTVCAGDPPPQTFSEFAQLLHARWELAPEEAIAVRREEDRQAMAVLGTSYRHFLIPDAIYRLHPKTGEPLYADWEEVIGGLHPGEQAYLQKTAQELSRHLNGDELLVVPLGVGNHVDHQFTRSLAQMLGLPLYFYPDYPYTLRFAEEIPYLAPSGSQPQTYAITLAGLAAWQESVACYASQISSFWGSLDEMKSAIKDFAQKYAGVTLWG